MLRRSLSFLSLLSLAVEPSQSYPDGAPSCLAIPNHGARAKRIRIKEKHRGLVINTRTGGLWWGHVPGYQDKGTCITHLDNTDKEAVTFVFRTHRDEIPEFTGFIVYNYRSYARLEADSDNYLDISGRANNTEVRTRFLARFGLTDSRDNTSSDNPYHGANSGVRNEYDRFKSGGHNSAGFNSVGNRNRDGGGFNSFGNRNRDGCNGGGFNSHGKRNRDGYDGGGFDSYGNRNRDGYGGGGFNSYGNRNRDGCNGEGLNSYGNQNRNGYIGGGFDSYGKRNRGGYS